MPGIYERFNSLIVSVLIAIGSIWTPSDTWQLGQLCEVTFQVLLPAYPVMVSMLMLIITFLQCGQIVMFRFRS